MDNDLEHLLVVLEQKKGSLMVGMRVAPISDGRACCLAAMREVQRDRDAVDLSVVQLADHLAKREV